MEMIKNHLPQRHTESDRKTILVCLPCLLTGGTEIQTLNLVQALAEGGHRVVTVCYFEHSRAMQERFEQAGSRVVLLSPDGTRTGGWRILPFLYKGLRRIVREVRPDMVHVQYMAPGAIPILLLRLMGVRQIIATTHTGADIYPNLKLVHFIQRHCVRAFTCITELAEQSFFGNSHLYSEQTALKKRNHFTIYNALSRQFADLPPMPRTFNGTITLGVVSRLEQIKGMDLVIPAFAEIRKQCPDTRLLVVGDGSLRASMQQQAESLGCADAIEWAGRQPQEALPGWYRRMDIVLMPSRSEGFGLTAIEAMSCGCVVVASRTGGLPEVVRDGEVGLLHTPESAQDIAEKVLELIEHPERLEEMSARAVHYVTRFSFDRYATLFNNLYRNLTTNP